MYGHDSGRQAGCLSRTEPLSAPTVTDGAPLRLTKPPRAANAQNSPTGTPGPNSRRVPASWLARTVPYKRLLKAIGRRSDNSSSRHLLCQYVSTLREALLADKSPYFVTVIQDVGYGLCELAKDPRRTVGVRRDDGASEMGRRVRQLRIAAGLTQTALAKRAGMDRTHLNRLERGYAVPTIPTLQRLAQTLQVTPRSLL
jgi:DNA-binding XRE family transcriptional regulator